MNGRIYPYNPDGNYIAKYNYKYLRLSALYFCKENGLDRSELYLEVERYLNFLSDELEINDVDIKDCVGAVMFLVSQGEGTVDFCIKKYSEPFRALNEN
jgi:hypothetical protein